MMKKKIDSTGVLGPIPTVIEGKRKPTLEQTLLQLGEIDTAAAAALPGVAAEAQRDDVAILGYN